MAYQPRHLAPPVARRRPRWRRWSVAFAAVVALAAAGTWRVIGVEPRDPRASEVAAAGTSTTSSTTTTTTVPTTTTLAPRRASLVLSGDVLIHGSVAQAASVPGGHDFSPMFAPIAPLVSGADLALCHLEVTLARPGEPLSGYPRFRAPARLAHDLATAGYDGCSVASNHALDFGEAGVVATLDGLDGAGVRTAGTARDAATRQPTVYDAGGIAVAHLSYTYGFNGMPRPAGKEHLVDQIDPALILADATAARAAGAELVVVSLHWGDEYRHDVTDAQRAVADALAAVPGAVDLVAGHHAHVVQPISKVGDLWVVWGMGNLLSNNSTACCPATTADGVLVTVTIGDRPEPGRGAGVLGVAFTPTWNERTTFAILPIAATLSDNSHPHLNDELVASFQRTSGHVLALDGTTLGITPREPVVSAGGTG